METHPLFESVLFPTDLSPYATKTLECIGEIPGIRRVILLQVIDATHPSRRGWIHGPQIEQSRLVLADQERQLSSLGLEVSTMVRVIKEGNVPSAIMEAAERGDVSLIIMGARGMGVVEGLLLGSVSRAVIQRSSRSVLVMRHKVIGSLGSRELHHFCTGLFSRVLVPTDFSEPAGEALALLPRIGRVQEAVLLHVVESGETEREIEESVAEAMGKMERMVRDLEVRGIPSRTLVRVGRSVDRICEVAESEDASLVVMASRGKGWIPQILLGSTTQGVVSASPRPVLVVRKGGNGS